MRPSLDAARRRLVYEELFAIQLLMALRRESRAAAGGHPPGQARRPDPHAWSRALPFALTGAQRRVLGEILADLRSGAAMHRLLQGDVGSGKTLVALIAALFVIEQGYQALLMAPTEVLARQHGQTLRRLAEPAGRDGRDPDRFDPGGRAPRASWPGRRPARSTCWWAPTR